MQPIAVTSQRHCSVGERRDDTLPDLDLAREDRHRAIRLEAHPSVEAAVRFEIAGELGTGAHVECVATASFSASEG